MTPVDIVAEEIVPQQKRDPPSAVAAEKLLKPSEALGDKDVN